MPPTQSATAARPWSAIGRTRTGTVSTFVTAEPVEGLPMAIKIAIVPDLQIRPGLNLDHCTWISKYLGAKQPDVIVNLGDLWDFPSLSSFDKGKRAAENRRVGVDFTAGCNGVERLMEYVKHKPRWVFTEGNHCERLKRYANDIPELDTLPDPCAYLEDLGWETYPFLKPVRIGGVAFAHIFPKNAQGRETAAGQRMGPPSAHAMIKANMESCVMGHRQGLETAIFHTGRRTYRGIIAGSAYRHNESYLGPTQNYWRGILMAHEVRDGNFSLMEVTLNYLQGQYGAR
jgi:hypothetical protein